MQRLSTVGRRALHTTRASRDALNIVRELGPVGKGLRDMKSEVPELQRKLAAGGNFTFVKKETDKFTMMLVGSIMGCGTLIFLKGTVDMLFGKNKK